MSWVTGTASSHLDLLDRLQTFLTTDATLVSLNQQWEAVRPLAALPLSASLVGGNITFTSQTPTPMYVNAWPTGLPTDKLSRVEVSGDLLIPSDGTYQFAIRKSAEAQVYINGVLVYGHYSTTYTSAAPTTAEFSVVLTTGTHTIKVLWTAAASGARGLALYWKKPLDGSFTLIPAVSLANMIVKWAPQYNRVHTNAASFSAGFLDSEMVLKGPGLSESDEIYVTLFSNSNAIADYFNVEINGAVGYTATLPANEQPGSDASHIGALMWNQPMTYWFAASGRYFIVIAKVSTSYESLLGGFHLPSGLPTEFPYPIVIGGSATAPLAQATGLDLRWSDSTNDHASWWNPKAQSATYSTLKLRDIGGTWRYLRNNAGPPVSGVYPMNDNTPKVLRASPDSSYALMPLTMYRAGVEVYGEIDAAFYVSGFSNASENVITIDAVDYLVIQAANRTTHDSYAAIRLA